MMKLILILVVAVLAVGAAGYGAWVLFKKRRKVSAAVMGAAGAVADKMEEAERAAGKIEKTIQETEAGVRDQFDRVTK